MNGSATDQHGLMRLYMREISDSLLLSREDERDLAARIAEGDPEARDRLARANLRLVVTLARRYIGRGVAFEDLVAEGNLGLMRAVEGYDGNSGVRFSTYASFWIKQSLRAAIQKHGRPVRLPAYTHTLLLKWQQATKHLSEHLGRAPTDDEIARELKLSRRRLKIALQALRTARLSFGTFEDADSASRDDVRPPIEVLEQAEVSNDVSSWIHELDDREAAVIRMRFGFGNEPPMTFRAIGDRLNLTRERVRQLESRALQRLRELNERAARKARGSQKSDPPEHS